MHKNLLTSPIPIYDKIPPESEHKGNLPQHNKGHIKQTTANIILGGEKQNLPCTIRNNERMSFVTIFIQQSFCSPSHNNLSLISGSFHKPLILIHQKADRKKNHNHRKLTKVIT